MFPSSLMDHDVSVIFDGSTRPGEVLGRVLRFFSEGCIVQRLVEIAMLSKSLSGEELARELLTTLSTELGIGGRLLLAAILDRASVNGVAMRTLSSMSPDIIDIGCFSHTPWILWEQSLIFPQRIHP